MLNESNLDAGFDRIAQLAKRDGVELELIVERGENIALSVNDGKVEKFDSSHSQVGGLRVLMAGVEGYSWTESLDETSLEAAYRDAVESAKFASRGGENRSTDQVKREAIELWKPKTNAKEDMSLFNESANEVSLEEKIARVKRIETAAKAVDTRIAQVPYNGYSELSGEVRVYNTQGVRARQRRSGVTTVAYCLAKHGGETRMAGEASFTRDASNPSIEATAKKAADRSLAKLGAVSPDTGRYPILIDREVVADLFDLFANYFSAKALSEKASIFGKKPVAADNLGQVIASPLLTLTDDPSIDGGVGNRSFDSEGVPTVRTTLIQDGVLTSFLTNSVYARRLDLPHTASASRSARSQLSVGPSNLVVKPGKSTFQEMVAAHPRVIYITDFSGYHAGFRAGAGEFSFQSEGELWENGKLVKPLCSFVVSGSVAELLEGITHVGNELSPKVSTVLAPDLLIKSLSVAGA